MNTSGNVNYEGNEVISKNSIISIVRPLKRILTSDFLLFMELLFYVFSHLAFTIHLGAKFSAKFGCWESISGNGETISVDEKEVKMEGKSLNCFTCHWNDFQSACTEKYLPAEKKVALSGRLYGAISYQCKLQLSANWSNKQNGDHVGANARVNNIWAHSFTVIGKETFFRSFIQPDSTRAAKVDRWNKCSYSECNNKTSIQLFAV